MQFTAVSHKGESGGGGGGGLGEGGGGDGGGGGGGGEAGGGINGGDSHVFWQPNSLSRDGSSASFLLNRVLRWILALVECAMHCWYLVQHCSPSDNCQRGRWGIKNRQLAAAQIWSDTEIPWTLGKVRSGGLAHLAHWRGLFVIKGHALRGRVLEHQR